MGRKKLDMVLIESKKKRMMTFDKRKPAVMKKAYELSTLCDIQVCVIIFGPKEDPPYVWPEEPEKLNNILIRYMNTPLEERQKRALNLSSMLKNPQKDRILDIVNDKQESLPKFSFGRDDSIINFSSEQLMELINRLDSKIKIVNGKIDEMKMSQSSTKFEDAQYEEQKKTMMMTMADMQVMQNLQYQYQYQYQYLVEQKRNVDMITAMKMMNDGGFGNLNNDNVNVGDFNGLMGRNMINGFPLDPSPLIWYSPNVQLPVQAHQLNGCYQHFKNESTNH